MTQRMSVIRSSGTWIRIACDSCIGKPWFWVALGAITGALAARVGLCPDALIFYQAGLRTSLGQWAYVDYTLPHGPVAGWVLAPFFWLPTSGGGSLLVASAALNAAMT